MSLEELHYSAGAPESTPTNRKDPSIPYYTTTPHVTVEPQPSLHHEKKYESGFWSIRTDNDSKWKKKTMTKL